MSKLYKRNIHGSRIDYSSISLLSNKIEVLIIGGGRAGYLKSRSFLEKKSFVTLISENIGDDFEEFKSNSHFKYIHGKYETGMIDNYHIIVIAVDSIKVIDEVKKECDYKHKLYINCRDFKAGNISMPVNGQTDNIHYSIQTKGGSPKTSILMSEIIKSHLEEYNEYIDFSVNLRNSLKGDSRKNEIMTFVSTNDFLKLFMEKKGQTTLNTFCGGKKIERKNCNEKK